MRITIELNDREAAKVAAVKTILKCDNQTAVSLIIAACKRRDIEAALDHLKLSTHEEQPVG